MADYDWFVWCLLYGWYDEINFTLFPSNRFAFLAGIMMTIAMLGAVAAQGPLAFAVKQLGWRGTMQMLAIAGIVLHFIFLVISG